MEWLVPYYWAVAVSASAAQMTWWGWINQPPRELVADDGRAQLTALDLELVRIVYEVGVEESNCAICGAPLDPAVNIERAEWITGVDRTVARASEQDEDLSAALPPASDHRDPGGPGIRPGTSTGAMCRRRSDSHPINRVADGTASVREGGQPT